VLAMPRSGICPPTQTSLPVSWHGRFPPLRFVWRQGQKSEQKEAPFKHEGMAAPRGRHPARLNRSASLTSPMNNLHCSLGVCLTPTTAACRASAGSPRRVYSAPFSVHRVRLQAGPSLSLLLLQLPQLWLWPHMCDPTPKHRVLTPLHSCFAIPLFSIAQQF
jgi:hypothetical protein